MNKRSLSILLTAAVLLYAGIHVAGLSPKYGFYFAPAVAILATINTLFTEPDRKYYTGFGKSGNIMIAHPILFGASIIAFIAGAVMIYNNSKDSSGFVCLAIAVFLISFTRIKKASQLQEK